MSSTLLFLKSFAAICETISKSEEDPRILSVFKQLNVVQRHNDMIIATSNKVSHLMKSERILLTLEMHCWFLYSHVFGELDYKAAVFLWHFCDLLVIFFGELELMVVGAIFWLNLVQKKAAVRNIIEKLQLRHQRNPFYMYLVFVRNLFNICKKSI